MNQVVIKEQKKTLNNKKFHQPNGMQQECIFPKVVFLPQICAPLRCSPGFSPASLSGGSHGPRRATLSHGELQLNSTGKFVRLLFLKHSKGFCVRQQTKLAKKKKR